MGSRYSKITFHIPHPSLSRKDGLLFYSGNDCLNDHFLISAYHFGVFPCNGEDQPVLWWFPKERFIIDVDNMHTPKSMRTYFNNTIFTVTLDQHFEYIINRCQNIPRKKKDSGWITPDIKKAFIRLHELGYAHSVEVWKDNRIVGGLYGVGLGKIFSGESMFLEVSNASKFATLTLGRILREKGYTTIDCQQYSKHMESLGGYSVSHIEYFAKIKQNLLCESEIKKW